MHSRNPLKSIGAAVLTSCVLWILTTSCGGGGGGGSGTPSAPPWPILSVIQRFRHIETQIGDVEFAPRPGQQCNGYEYVPGPSCPDPILDKNPACFRPIGCASNRNQTASLFGGLFMGDTASPFRHQGRTYILWNDTGGLAGDPKNCGGFETLGYLDPTDTDPTDGLWLLPVDAPGGDVSFEGLATPKFVLGDPHPLAGPCRGTMLDGMSDNPDGTGSGSAMYVFYLDSMWPIEVQGVQELTQRLAVAQSTDGGITWTYLYDFSVEPGIGANGNCVEVGGTLADCRDKFARVQAVHVDAMQFEDDLWPGHPEGYLIYGVPLVPGPIYLAFLPSTDLATGLQVRTWTAAGWSGPAPAGDPVQMAQAAPVFTEAGVLGLEYSVTWQASLGVWLLSWTDSTGRSSPGNVYASVSWSPQGPWSPGIPILDVLSGTDGWGEFMHRSQLGAQQSCSQPQPDVFEINPPGQLPDFLWQFPTFSGSNACFPGWPYAPYMLEGYESTQGLAPGQLRVTMELSSSIPYVTHLGDFVIQVD